MAGEYQTTTVAGTSYIRAPLIEIRNTYGVVPSAIMKRERLFILDNEKTISESVSTLNIPYDTTKEYALLNPETGEATGQTTTLADIFVALYSVFVAESIIADTEPEIVNE